MKKIYVLFGMDMLCTSLFISIFQNHVIQLGASHSFTGFILSATAVLTILWKPLVGSLIDKIGSKTLLVLICSLHAIGTVFSMLATNKWMFLFVRMGCSVGAATQTILRRVVIDVVGRNDSAAVFNKIGAVFGLSFIFGSLIGGQLAGLKDGITYVYLLNFLITILIACVGITLPNTGSRDVPHPAETLEPPMKPLLAVKSIKDFVVSEKYWDLFALKIARDVNHFIIITSLRIMMLNVLGFSNSQISYMVVSMMICPITINLSQTKIRDKYYPYDDGFQRIKLMTIVGAVTSILTALVPSTFTIAMVVMTMALTSFECTLMEMLLNRIEDHDKGIVMSAYETLFNVVEIVIPSLAGIVTDNFGVRVTFIGCAVSNVVAYWIVIRQTVVEIRKSI